MRWLISYFSTALGLAYLLLVCVVVIFPVFFLMLLAQAAIPQFEMLGIALVMLVFAPVFASFPRFFFPVVFGLAFAGWRGMLCIEFLTPSKAINFASVHLADFRGGVSRKYSRILNWRNS